MKHDTEFANLHRLVETYKNQKSIRFLSDFLREYIKNTYERQKITIPTIYRTEKSFKSSFIYRHYPPESTRANDWRQLDGGAVYAAVLSNARENLTLPTVDL